MKKIADEGEGEKEFIADQIHHLLFYKKQLFPLKLRHGIAYFHGGKFA